MKIRLALVLVILALPFFASAQSQPEAQELLMKVSQTYRNLSNYYFECLTVTEIRTESERTKFESKSEEVMVSALIKPNKIRTEVRSPHFSLVMVSDGQTKWVYAPGLNQYSRQGSENLPPPYRFLADQATRLISAYQQLTQDVREGKILREETLQVQGEEIPCLVIEGVRASSPAYLEPPRVQLWIDKIRHLIVREVFHYKMKTPYGSLSVSTSTRTFNILKINEKLPDSLFAFSAPAEAREVAELTIPGLSRPEIRPLEIIGKDALDFTLKDLGNKQVSLKELRGNIVLLNFWASWCGPCRIEMPHLEKLHRELKNKGLVVLGINDESPEIARQFIKTNGYTFTTLVDEGREVAGNYQVRAIPQVFIIDKNGRVATHFVGARSEHELREALKRAETGVESAASIPPRPSSPPGDGNALQKQPCVPVLLSPRPGGLLPNGRSDKPQEVRWEFAWAACPGATQYHLYIENSNARTPMVNVETIRITSYQHISRGYVADHNLRGWKWKVRAKINGVWGEWSKPEMFKVKPLGSASEVVGESEPGKGLSAPKPITPADGTVFHHYPRETLLQWEAVPGAESYCIETDFSSSGKWRSESGRPSIVKGVETTYYALYFVGAQPGRWRVWAVGAEGQEGPQSQWREFRYTR